MEVSKVLPFKLILPRYRHSVLRIAGNLRDGVAHETIPRNLCSLALAKAEPVGL